MWLGVGAQVEGVLVLGLLALETVVLLFVLKTTQIVETQVIIDKA